jgi:dihydroflavonol-4-reductase
MQVLVLGANGYTGTKLVRALLERNHKVRGLVRQVENGLMLEKQGMELRVGDVRSEASIRELGDDCEVIFNLVASCRIEPSESKIILQDAARNLFRIADRAVLKKYIWCSNVSVYGYPKLTDRLTETSPLKPAYALGKQTVDAENLARESLPSIAIRVPSIYGKGRDFVAALRESRLRLLNGGDNWSSRIHVDDLVSLLSAAAGAPMPLNLEVTAARAFGMLGRAMNSLSGERQYQLSENVIGLLTGNYFCVNDKIKNELGVKLLYPTFRDGYKEILQNG